MIKSWKHKGLKLFFETGNPKPTEAGTELLKALAAELLKLPNKIAIEGHTDSQPYGRSDYSNWELSTDRANAARRVLAGLGMDECAEPTEIHLGDLHRR